MPDSYLHVQTTKAIWKNSDTNLYADIKNATVWRINIPTLIPHLSELLSLLDLQEIEKIKRYQQEKDRQSRIISRSILKIILSRYLSVNPNEIKFELDQNNKLTLQNKFSINLHFNISHSGDWVLIAISNNQIGIDVEKVNASFIYQNLLDFSFSVEEKIYIQSTLNPHQNFYKLWTRKEALLKATGKGLIDELNQVPSLDGIHQNPGNIIGSDESWQVTSFTVDENHLSSAAFMPVKTVLHFFNFQL